MKALWEADESTGTSGYVSDATLFEIFSSLLIGNGNDYVDARTFVLSDHGWSLIMDVLGDKDPADVRRGTLHLRKGVPTNSRTGERRRLIMDLERGGSNVIQGPGVEILDKGQSFVPRSATHIHKRTEYISPSSNAFFLELQSTGTEEGLAQPQDQLHAEGSQPLQVRSDQPLKANSGYRIMHDALWKATVTEPCKHGKVKAGQGKVPMGIDVVTTNAVAWGRVKSLNCDFLPERVCVLLVKGDQRSRFLALQATSNQEDRRVILRHRRTCEECAIALAARSEGAWFVIL